jgi:outer membrane protein with glycine zipper
MRKANLRTPAALSAALALGSPAVQAQVPTPQQLGLYVYPAKGQPPAQQQAEQSECYGWAQKQTGIDPTAPVTVATPPPQEGLDGSMVKGGAKGAAAGAAIGAIAGDTGEGAAIGAVAGALRGRRKSKEAKKQQEAQAQQQAQAQVAQVHETFNKAYGACLEGKGYTVK